MFLRVVKVVLIVIVASVVLGLVVEHLWNWLMPTIFGLKTIGYWQAVGLLLLSKILLGGFHKHGGARQTALAREDAGALGGDVARGAREVSCRNEGTLRGFWRARLASWRVAGGRQRGDA